MGKSRWYYWCNIYGGWRRSTGAEVSQIALIAWACGYDFKYVYVEA